MEPVSPRSFEFHGGPAENQPAYLQPRCRSQGWYRGHEMEPDSWSESEDESDDQDEVRRRIARLDDRASLHQSSFGIWSRMPVGHLLSFAACFVSGILFSVQVHACLNGIMVALQEIMHISYAFLQPLIMVTTASGCIVAALSSIIFISSLISCYYEITSDQSGSRTVSMVFIVILYPCVTVWCLLTALMLATWVVSLLLEGCCANSHIASVLLLPNISSASSICNSEVVQESGVRRCVDCIDLYPFHFLFPLDTRKEDMEICGRELWMLCSRALPEISHGSLICLISGAVVVAAVVLHLACLSFDRTRSGTQRLYKRERDRILINRRVKKAISRSSIRL